MELNWKTASSYSTDLTDLTSPGSSATTSTATGGGGRNRHTNLDDSHKLLETYTHTNNADEPESHLAPYTTQRSNDSSKNRSPSSRQISSGSSTDQQEGGVAEGQGRGGGGGGDFDELIAKLEVVTLERDELKLGKERVQALFEGRIRRMQKQLVRSNIFSLLIVR